MTTEKIKTLHQTLYGDIDLWSFHLTDTATMIHTNNQRSFLNYLCSRGTLKALLEDANPKEGSCGVMLVGPKCDDGDRLLLYYKLYAKYIHDTPPFGLNPDEKKVLVGMARDALSRSGKTNAFGLFTHCLRLPRVF